MLKRERKGVSSVLALVLVISIVIIAFLAFYNFGDIVNEKSLEADNINQITGKVVQDYSDCEPYITKNYVAYRCYNYSSLQCLYYPYCVAEKKIAAEACQIATDKCEQFFDSLDCPYELMEALEINYYAIPSFPIPGHDCSALVPDIWCRCTNLISSNYFNAGIQWGLDYVYWDINSLFGDYNLAKAKCTNPIPINYQCRTECPDCHCCKNIGRLYVETHMAYGTPAGSCYVCDGDGNKFRDESKCKLSLFADRGSQQDLVVFDDNNPIPIGNKDNPDYYLLYLGKDDKLGCSNADLSWVEDSDITKVWLESEGKKIAEKSKSTDSNLFSGGSYIFQDSDLYKDNSPTLPRGNKTTCKIQANVDGTTKTYSSYDLIIIERNLKDKAKYEINGDIDGIKKQPAFLVSYENENGKLSWREVLQQVPAVMWKNSSNDNWCNKLKYLDIEWKFAVEINKCGYPLIVINYEQTQKAYDNMKFDDTKTTGVFGDNSIEDNDATQYSYKQFLEQNPYFVPTKISSGMWKEAGTVVISNFNDYETGLIASQLASYLNAPVFFVGKENEKDWERSLKNRMIIAVGQIESQSLEKIKKNNLVLTYNNGFYYNPDNEADSTLSSVSQIDEFMANLGMNSEKIIIVNPNDIKQEYCEKDKSGKKSEYCAMSLLSPVLGFGDDKKIGFVEEYFVPGFIEMKEKNYKIEQAYNNGMYETNPGYMEELENELKALEDQVVNRAIEIHAAIANLLSDGNINFAYVLAAPKAIPGRLVPERFGNLNSLLSFDNYYFDRDGVLDGDCCDCTFSPDISYSRLFGKKLSYMSSEIAAILFKVPKSDCLTPICHESSPPSQPSDSLSIDDKAIKDPLLQYVIMQVYGYRIYTDGADMAYMWSNVQDNQGIKYAEQLEDFLFKNEQTKLNMKFGIAKQLYGETIFKVRDGWNFPYIIPTIFVTLLSPANPANNPLILEDKEKLIVVATYYYIMNQLRQGLSYTIETVGNSDSLLEPFTNKPIFYDLEIHSPTNELFPEAEDDMENFVPGSYTFSKLQKETVEAIQYINDLDKNKNKISQELNLLKNRNDNDKVFISGGMRTFVGQGELSSLSEKTVSIGEYKKILEDESESMDGQKELMKSMYYWIEGDTFKETVTEYLNRNYIIYPDDTWGPPTYEDVVKNARESDLNEAVRLGLKAQIEINGEEARKYITDVNNALVCIKDSNGDIFKECYSKVMGVLSRSPPRQPLPYEDFTSYRATMDQKLHQINDKIYEAHDLGNEEGELWEEYDRILKQTKNTIQDYNHEKLETLDVNAYLLNAGEAINSYTQQRATYTVVSEIGETIVVVTALTIATMGLGTAAAGISGALIAVNTGRTAAGLAGLVVAGINYRYLYLGLENTIISCQNAVTGSFYTTIGRQSGKVNIGSNPIVVRDIKGCIISAAMTVPFAIGAIHDIKQSIRFVGELPIATEFRTKNPLKFSRVTNKAGECFLPGTKIKMADGTEKNIENIKEGEKVIAYDIEKNIAVEAKVTKTFARQSDDYLIIEYEVEDE